MGLRRRQRRAERRPAVRPTLLPSLLSRSVMIGSGAAPPSNLQATRNAQRYSANSPDQ